MLCPHWCNIWDFLFLSVYFAALKEEACRSHLGLQNSQSDIQRYTRGTSPLCCFFRAAKGTHYCWPLRWQNLTSSSLTSKWKSQSTDVFLSASCNNIIFLLRLSAPVNEPLSHVKPSECQVWVLFKWCLHFPLPPSTQLFASVLLQVCLISFFFSSTRHQLSWSRKGKQVSCTNRHGGEL